MKIGPGPGQRPLVLATTVSFSLLLIVCLSLLGITLYTHSLRSPSALTRTARTRVCRSYNCWIVQMSFTESKVVPDVIEVAPSEKAKVSYDSGVSAELGNVLTPTQVKNAPTVTWTHEEGAYYTLIMTDPDAPSRADPKWSEWRHWLVFNIPGNDISKGDEWWTYVGSGPPEGTGLHRYIFLIYKQPGRLTPTDPKVGHTGKARNNTKVRYIAVKYGLGNPVAGNFYQAEWDDYVPILYKSFDD